MTGHTSRPRRILGVTGALVLAALTLAACGGGSSDKPSDSASSTPASNGTSGSGASGRFGAGGGSAASGQIAEIDGDAVQVQNTSEQTTVDLSASTGYTLRETTNLSGVKLGSCVVAVAPASTSTASAATSRPTAITASTVMISPAVNGACAAGFGGAGGRPGGAPTSFPSRSFPGGERSGARPSGFPSGARRGGFGDIVTGKVTKLSGSMITVDAVRRAAAGSSSTTTQTDTVTVTAATTYTTTVTVTRSALKVGLCASAFGPTDSTGAVHATRVDLSSPQNGSCTAGFFGRGANPGGTNG